MPTPSILILVYTSFLPLHDRYQLADAIDALADLGYTLRGELGIVGRHAFEHTTSQRATLPGGGLHGNGNFGDDDDGGGRRNVYVCMDDSPSLQNHLLLRDYLRQTPAAVAEYAALKWRLAGQYPNDVEGYCEGKTGLIVRMLAAAGWDDPDALTAIAVANQVCY